MKNVIIFLCSKKSGFGTKGAERLLHPPVRGEGCSFMKMCLAHPVFPLPLGTPRPSLVFLKKKHDKLQTFISPGSESREVEDHGASRSSVWEETRFLRGPLCEAAGPGSYDLGSFGTGPWREPHGAYEPNKFLTEYCFYVFASEFCEKGPGNDSRFQRFFSTPKRSRTTGKNGKRVK